MTRLLLTFAAVLGSVGGAAWAAEEPAPLVGPERPGILPLVIRAKCAAEDGSPTLSTKGDASGVRFDTPTPTGAVQLYVDGKPFNPCAKKSLSPLVQAALGTGTGYKLYSFSNVGTEKQLRQQLRTVGLPTQQVTRWAPKLFTWIKSKPAKRLFLLFTLAEASFGAYELVGVRNGGNLDLERASIRAPIERQVQEGKLRPDDAASLISNLFGGADPKEAVEPLIRDNRISPQYAEYLIGELQKDKP
jgi:hypothetical protein